MEGWLIALIVKPFVLIGLVFANGKTHAFLHKVLPEGKIKTALLRER